MIVARVGQIFSCFVEPLTFASFVVTELFRLSFKVHEKFVVGQNQCEHIPRRRRFIEFTIG